MTKLSHKEMTKHLRNRLKQNGVKARCRMATLCGTNYVQIITPSYEVKFTSDEMREIAQMCKTNGLTCAQKGEIDVEHYSKLTNLEQVNFEYHG